jgi:TP901 family phage tail tape measure protein
MATNTEKIVVQVVVKGQKELQNLEGTTKKSTRGVGALVKQYGLLTAGVAGAVQAFRSINKMVATVIRTFRDFEFQMAKVRAITGSTDNQIQALSDTAQELGRTTFFTASQVAELQTNFGKLGFTTSEILAAQEATLQLATATESDLARAAIVAGAAVRGFGLNATETQRVVDVMATSFTSSALDLEKFQTSMTKVAPIAANANISLEATTAIMGTLTDAGIEASIAGTSLRNIFLKMQDPTSELTKKIGFTVNSTSDLFKAIQILNDANLKNSEIQQVVDKRQVAAFSTILKGADSIRHLHNLNMDASGSAQEMADIVGDNLEGSFKRLQSAIEGLSIVLFESFVGKALQKFIDKGAEALNILTLLIEGFESQDEKIASTAAMYKNQAIAFENLMNRYDELNKITNRTVEENEELESVLKTLQDEIGDTVVSIDAETDALILNRDALQDVIAKTALLADTEALKLVHKMQNIDKEIEAEQKLNDELQKTANTLSTTGTNIISVADATNQSTQAFDAFGNAIQSANDQSTNLEDTQADLAVSDMKLLEAQERKAEIVALLTERGWNQLEIERLLTEQAKIRKKAVTPDEAGEDVEGEAEKENIFSKIKLENLKAELDLQAKILQDKKHLLTFDEDFAAKKISILEKTLATEKLTAEEQMKIQKMLNDLKINGLKDEDKERKTQINNMAKVGDQLINLAGNDEKYQSVRKAGVRISAAAALANNAESLSLQMKGLSKDLSKGFPTNLIAVASTLALLLSMKQNFKALTTGEQFANGGMVHGKSHAQGGEKFAVGGRVVELEGGEAVINKRSTSMFKNQLSAMNVAGGGVKFADGGLMNMPSFAQSQFNATSQAGMMGAIGQGSKVVVVESDISQVQNTVSVIEAEATF